MEFSTLYLHEKMHEYKTAFQATKKNTNNEFLIFENLQHNTLYKRIDRLNELHL